MDRADTASAVIEDTALPERRAFYMSRRVSLTMAAILLVTSACVVAYNEDGPVRTLAALAAIGPGLVYLALAIERRAGLSLDRTGIEKHGLFGKNTAIAWPDVISIEHRDSQGEGISVIEVKGRDASITIDYGMLDLTKEGFYREIRPYRPDLVEAGGQELSSGRTA